MKNKTNMARERANTVLKSLEQSSNQRSNCINESIIKNVVPVYIPQLQVYAIHLIDRVGIPNQNNELAVQAATIEMLLDSINWFKNEHHLNSCDVLEILLNFFCRSSWSGGVCEAELDEDEMKKFDDFITKLLEVDPDASTTFNGWGDLTAKVLNHWDRLWDCDWAYDALIYMLRKEHAKEYINPICACLIVKDLERQYLLEQAHLN